MPIPRILAKFYQVSSKAAIPSILALWDHVSSKEFYDKGAGGPVHYIEKTELWLRMKFFLLRFVMEDIHRLSPANGSLG